MATGRELSVGSKLAAAFGALFLVVAGVGVFNADQMRAVSGAGVEIESQWLPSIQALDELKLIFTRARLIGARVIATGDPTEREAVEQRHQKFLRWVAEASARYELVIKTAQEQEIYNQFLAAWHDYVEYEAPLLAAPHDDAAAMTGFNFDAQKRYAKTLDALDRLTDLNRRRVAEAVASGAETYRRALWLTGSMTLFAAVLAIGAALWLNRAVVSRVVRLSYAMRSLARRDYAFSLPNAGADEIGDMTRAVEECRQGLKQADAMAHAQRAAEHAKARAEAELTLAQQREQAERELRLQHVRFGAALENMSQGLCMFDAAGRLVVANGRFAELFGLPETAVRPGITFDSLTTHMELLGRLGATDIACMRHDIDRLANGKRSEAIIWELVDGRALSVNLRVFDKQGWLATYQDVTERREAEAKIAFMAHHDALTGLPNRVLFRQRLEAALMRACRGEVSALLYLDLDNFKAVNDTLGHPAGDTLLNAVTERLRQHVRESDTIARLGGDEFAIVHSALDRPADASGLARRLVKALAAPYEIEDHQVVIGASIGITVISADGESPDLLLKHADIALYMAKADGRGTYRFFEPEMDARMQARRSMELELRRALAMEEFELFYQPIMNLRTHLVSGFEALIRWRHPTRGLVLPAEFIRLAEDTGLIAPIGDWVVRRACFEAAEWAAPMKVAVNLSPAQFTGRGPVHVVAAALATSGLEPSRLELEITETVMMEDNDAVLTVLRELKSLGVKIAIDDFGSGYSSLNYLKRFSFDRIKIDRSYVSDIDVCKESEAIVHSLTGLCTVLGIATTAEGVETELQLEKLRCTNCTDVQGFLFSPARPATEVPSLCRDLELAFLKLHSNHGIVG
jgi:diguanylate cyclase (GGDEF)-like protein